MTHNAREIKCCKLNQHDDQRKHKKNNRFQVL